MTERRPDPEQEGFLARWSRRKRQAGVEEEAERPPSVPDASGVEGAEAPDREAAGIPPPGAEPAPPAVGTVGPGAPPAPPFDPATLPPVESLTAESDIRDFLRPEVPQVLRQAALRRVWTLDPAIRDFVGLADYAWDFNAVDGVPGFAPSLDGDVARLLAQAVGLDGGTPAAPRPQGADEPPAAEAASEASPEPPDAVGATLPPAAPADSPEASAPPQPEPEPQPATRRHGGAIPVWPAGS